MICVARFDTRCRLLGFQSPEVALPFYCLAMWPESDRFDTKRTWQNKSLGLCFAPSEKKNTIRFEHV